MPQRLPSHIRFRVSGRWYSRRVRDSGTTTQAFRLEVIYHTVVHVPDAPRERRRPHDQPGAKARCIELHGTAFAGHYVSGRYFTFWSYA